MNLTWKDYIDKLGLKLNGAENEIKALVKTLNLSSENEAFFYYLKNAIGSHLNEIGEEWTDLFAWLKIVKKGNYDWYMFDFEEVDDYMLWKEMRLNVFSQVSPTAARLINLFEINCVNFIAESIHIKNEDLKEYYMAECDFEKIIFVTNGKIVKFLDNRYMEFESLDFVNFYKLMFQKGYKVYPLGQSVPEHIK